MPSVMHTTSGISAAMASSMPAAASGGLVIGFLLVRVVPGGLFAGGFRSSNRRSLRHEDGGGGRARLLHGVADVGKDGEAQMRLAGLLGVCAANNLGAWRNREYQTLCSPSAGQPRSAANNWRLCRRDPGGFTIVDRLLRVESGGERLSVVGALKHIGVPQSGCPRELLSAIAS